MNATRTWTEMNIEVQFDINSADPDVGIFSGSTTITGIFIITPQGALEVPAGPVFDAIAATISDDDLLG